MKWTNEQIGKIIKLSTEEDDLQLIMFNEEGAIVENFSLDELMQVYKPVEVINQIKESNMCKYCEENHLLPTDGTEAYIEVNEPNNYILVCTCNEVEIMCIYCPMCGRKL